jgi:hypothetical protein
MPRHYFGLSRPDAVDSTSQAIIPLGSLFFPDLPAPGSGVCRFSLPVAIECLPDVDRGRCDSHAS